MPESVQAAVRTLLNWCNVYQAEAESLEALDLERTPARVARMLRYELLQAYAPGVEAALQERFTTFVLPPNSSQEMIAQQNIPFYSLCAHHMVPFFGVVAIGYIPGDCLVGLSKLARVVDHFAHRLQIQERLTSQIADYLVSALDPQAVVVVVKAEHLCMSARGVAKPGSVTMTSALRGAACSDESVKQEFYQILGV